MSDDKKIIDNLLYVLVTDHRCYNIIKIINTRKIFALCIRYGKVDASKNKFVGQQQHLYVLLNRY